MGRPAFTRFLVTATESSASRDRGVHWGTRFASWDTLLADGRRRAGLVTPGRAYLVDPAAELESIVSLLAVATVPDTVLVWASAAGIDGPVRELALGLFEVDNPVDWPVDRPLWAIATSGSSGTPKFAVGYADTWELIALHYERAMCDGSAPPVFATCLPLQFSAAFFMTVLPSLFLRRDLMIFDPRDWTPVQELGARTDTLVLGVPALAAAACLGMLEPADMPHARLFLGGGHLSVERVALIRDRFRGASIANLYGTAETGAIAVDHDPGHNQHVGAPIPGKAVWLVDRDEHGVGTVAVAGPDCARWVWRPGEGVKPTRDGYVTGTDYGSFDADGNLRLEGRVDGSEKFRGVLIYPRSIERHLLSLNGIADARVLVRRTESGLEHLLAKVVGSVDDDAVRAHCATLPELERPTRIECVPETEALFAYSANGKL